ncbi:MAG: DUF1848 domain-containing protein [Candidatus Riflebacteria bacterium]|nr:DUF1848 domain-containing protein [Candidatus Riflebacteria bacterium]
MIVSVSRRTDIPAFYSEWFFNRIKAGYVQVRNPMNYHQVSEIKLTPENVDCFIFWTKNPANFLSNIALLERFKYYFQFTLTPYGKNIEKNLPPKEEVIQTFQDLSNRIGRHLVLWRYDPILINGSDLSISYHEEQFEYLSEKLAKSTRKCIVSFFDKYKFAKFNSNYLSLKDFSSENVMHLAQKFSKIAARHSLVLETCAESFDLSSFNIAHGKCVDNRLLSEMLGYNIEIDKDKYQREFCGCVKSVDIGTYSTCLHDCSYCYATQYYSKALANFEQHIPNSPFLIGGAMSKDRVIVRKGDTHKVHQLSLLNFTE